MFEDSLVALMVMLLLCFLGMLVMFLFIIRSNNEMASAIKEAQRQNNLALGDIERHIMDLSFQVREITGKGVRPTGSLDEDLGNILGALGKSPSGMAGLRAKVSEEERKDTSAITAASAKAKNGLPDLSLGGKPSAFGSYTAGNTAAVRPRDNAYRQYEGDIQPVQTVPGGARGMLDLTSPSSPKTSNYLGAAGKNPFPKIK